MSQGRDVPEAFKKSYCKERKIFQKHEQVFTKTIFDSSTYISRTCSKYTISPTWKYLCKKIMGSEDHFCDLDTHSLSSKLLLVEQETTSLNLFYMIDHVEKSAFPILFFNRICILLVELLILKYISTGVRIFDLKRFSYAHSSIKEQADSQ